MIYVIGHKNPDTDSICSAIAYAELKKKLGVDVKAARNGEINPETAFVLEKFGFDVPELVTDGTDKKLILVDHSDVSQCVENLDKAEIVEIIDHHKIGDVTTPNPIFFLAMPVGSTATVVKTLYDYYNVEISKEIAGILLSAILSDTVIFKSPTTTEKDINAAEELAKIAGIEDLNTFGIQVKSKLSDVEKLTAEEIITRDFKDFNMSGKKVGIGQIELVDLKLIEERIDELLQKMAEIKEEGSYSGIYLMLTDIIREGTLLLAIVDDEKVVERAFGKKLENSRVWLDKVMSRKKEIVPPLESAYSAG
ncbi:manganese-dependent inorganic pyrophosphatase [Geoglobus acetivorans]|uniref:inorganic diphosphatase n=1 Tax=Geoglobus acetivorans TaxID=565033 RepID=A0A0A7GGK5_GEOAI|nr:Manganese-dependent inorganic pyrophosphatase [Geoglobus acetivorans]